MQEIWINSILSAAKRITVLLAVLVITIIPQACAGKPSVTANDKVERADATADGVVIIKAAESLNSSPRSYQYWYDRGMNSVHEGRYEEAKQAYRQALQINPDSAEAHFGLGVAYDELGDTKYALRALKQAISLVPDFTDAHFRTGLIYDNLKKNKPALESFNNVIRTDPAHADAHYYAGKAYLGLRLKNEAQQAFENAIAIKPEFADAHYALGTIFVMVEDIAAAVDQYKILVNLESRRAAALFDLIYK